MSRSTKRIDPVLGGRNRGRARGWRGWWRRWCIGSGLSDRGCAASDRERSNPLSARVRLDGERDDAISESSGTCHHRNPRRIAGRGPSASARRHSDRRTGTSSRTDGLTTWIDRKQARRSRGRLHDRRALARDDHAASAVARIVIGDRETHHATSMSGCGRNQCDPADISCRSPRTRVGGRDSDSARSRQAVDGLRPGNDNEVARCRIATGAHHRRRPATARSHQGGNQDED